MSVIDFNEQRTRLGAEKYYFARAAALLKLFKNANGRDALSTEELETWAVEHPPEPFDPYEVLTREELAELE